MSDLTAEPGGGLGAEPDAGPGGVDSNRDMGDFTLVGGKPRTKRLRVTSNDTDERSTVNPFKFIITPTQPGKSLYKINPIRLSKEIDKECGALKSVKKIGKSLAAVCYNSKQAQRLNNMTTLCGVDVGVAPETPQTKGVIVGVDLDITEDDLLDELSDQVTQVKRITRRSGGEVTPTKAVVLWFDTSNLPTTINIGYEIKKVMAYRPPVSRCYNCQRYGHSAHRCNAKIRCPRCSQGHKWEDCPNKKETPKCANCGGNHSAAYMGCNKYKVAKDIHIITRTEKLSFAEATKKYINNNKNALPNPKPAPQLVVPPAAGASVQLPQPLHSKQQSQQQQPLPQRQQQRQQQQHPQQQQQQQQQKQQVTSEEDNNMDTSTPIVYSKTIETQTECQADNSPLIINENMLAFLAFIINNLTESPTKSSRIQLVVDAAKFCCGVNIATSKVLDILTNE